MIHIFDLIASCNTINSHDVFEFTQSMHSSYEDLAFLLLCDIRSFCNNGCNYSLNGVV